MTKDRFLSLGGICLILSFMIMLYDHHEYFDYRAHGSRIQTTTFSNPQNEHGSIVFIKESQMMRLRINTGLIVILGFLGFYCMAKSGAMNNNGWDFKDWPNQKK